MRTFPIIKKLFKTLRFSFCLFLCFKPQPIKAHNNWMSLSQAFIRLEDELDQIPADTEHPARKSDILQTWESFDLWPQDKALLGVFLEDLTKIHTLDGGHRRLKSVRQHALRAMLIINANVRLLQNSPYPAIALASALKLQVDAGILIAELNAKILRVEALLAEADVPGLLRKADELEVGVFGSTGHILPLWRARSTLARSLSTTLAIVDDDDDDDDSELMLELDASIRVESLVRRKQLRAQQRVSALVKACIEDAIKYSLRHYLPLEKNPNFEAASHLALRARLMVRELPSPDDEYRSYEQQFRARMQDFVTRSRLLLSFR